MLQITFAAVIASHWKGFKDAYVRPAAFQANAIVIYVVLESEGSGERASCDAEML